MTITEALSELKIIGKKIEKKKQFVYSYVVRNSIIKDPHEKEGGSSKLVNEEMQSIDDLFRNYTNIRTKIQETNLNTSVTIGETTRNIAEWLNWRKEVAEQQKKIYQETLTHIQQSRRSVSGQKMPDGTVQDVLVFVNESELSKKLERLETQLEELDGQLSVKNATTQIH